MLGNHTKLRTQAAGQSLSQSIEGDLLSPRYEDPRAGTQRASSAPGGSVIRTDTEGTFIETFAGGLRNARPGLQSTESCSPLR
jgi:hypothetical protein